MEKKTSFCFVLFSLIRIFVVELKKDAIYTILGV